MCECRFCLPYVCCRCTSADENRFPATTTQSYVDLLTIASISRMVPYFRLWKQSQRLIYPFTPRPASDI